MNEFFFSLFQNHLSWPLLICSKSNQVKISTQSCLNFEIFILSILTRHSIFRYDVCDVSNLWIEKSEFSTNSISIELFAIAALTISQNAREWVLFDCKLKIKLKFANFHCFRCFRKNFNWLKRVHFFASKTTKELTENSS